MKEELELFPGIPRFDRAGLAAYEAGRLLNELGWHLDQAVVLGHLGPIAGVERMLIKLASTVFAISPVDEANRLKELLLQVLEGWHKTITSEWVAEELWQARQDFEGDRDAILDECFCDLLLTARVIKQEVRGDLPPLMMPRSMLLPRPPRP